MSFLDQKFGPLTGRCYGLFLIFLANALAIHGAIRHLIRNENPLEMYIGIVMTFLLCIIVAIPSKGAE